MLIIFTVVIDLICMYILIKFQKPALKFVLSIAKKVFSQKPSKFTGLFTINGR